MQSRQPIADSVYAPTSGAGCSWQCPHAGEMQPEHFTMSHAAALATKQSSAAPVGAVNRPCTVEAVFSQKAVEGLVLLSLVWRVGSAMFSLA